MEVRTLWVMQVLVILPIVFYIFIYTHGLGYYVLASSLLVLVALNTYRGVKKKDLYNYPLLALLVGGFFLYTFYGLGTTQVPQTYTTLENEKSVTRFTFSKPEQIDKICYYVGIDKNVNFVLEYKNQKLWKKFYTYNKGYPFSFKWKCIKKKFSTTDVLLRITKNKMMLNEMRFYFQDKSIAYKTNTKFLNDEKQMKVDTSYYSSMFFDEIYFGRTAFEIKNHWGVYENTHPYLGKLLMIPGIKIFGMTPLGWRTMNALFAGLLIFMAYYFALHIFREKIYALGSAILMTYSFMHLAQARIALIDTFGVLFVFISYFYLYRFIVKQQLSRLLVSGVFFGLAAAVKWSAVFAAVGFVLIALYLLISRYQFKKQFSGYKLILYGFLAYGVVAFSVYMLTFFDIYFQSGVKGVVLYNLNMYNYHSTLIATHPYSSPWWSWPLDLKPMGYYKHIKDGVLSSINVFGNPAIFWVGIVAIAHIFVVVVRKFTLEAAFILLAFVGLYLPYIFVGRLMFIYHFYYAVPFLILAIIYMFRDSVERFAFMRSVYLLYLLIVIGLFLAFYPVLSGHLVENTYVSTWLKWGDTWWF